MPNIKKLPVGIQTFKDIIEENYLYIDKTDIAYNLISSYKYAFLSRPRRFGKSLFIDTLQNIFEGIILVFIIVSFVSGEISLSGLSYAIWYTLPFNIWELHKRNVALSFNIIFNIILFILSIVFFYVT